MGRLKEFYHEEISEGLKPITEPYIFKYTVYFKYNGESYSIFADTPAKVEDLVKTQIPDFIAMSHGPIEGEYIFLCKDIEIPVQLFENTNPIY